MPPKRDLEVLSRLPLDPSEYMEDCTAEMEKDAICATLQAVIHQETRCNTLGGSSLGKR